MSEWNSVEDNDISIDRVDREVSILAGSNDFGTIFAVLTFEQWLKVANKLREEPSA